MRWPMRMRWVACCCLGLVVALSPSAQAAGHDRSVRRLVLDVPLLSVRENAIKGYWPSMRQSLQLTKTVTYLARAGIVKVAELADYPEFFSQTAVDVIDSALLVALDGLLLWNLPLQPPWMHEEWHRAVMSRRGIASYNGVYDFDFAADVVPVRSVRDEDLIRLKRDYPAEMVRLSSAGFEAEVSLMQEFDEDRFFRGTRARVTGSQWFIALGVSTYWLAAAYASEGVTRRVQEQEGTRISARDFTGLDPVGWVYDLHRPDELYAERGIHPSGVGIDRYRTESDLTPRELRYLRTQAWLSLLNFANTNLLGLSSFPWQVGEGEPWRWNVTLQHLPAPFGVAFRINGFLAAAGRNWLAQLQANVNDSLVLPGLTLKVLRQPLVGLADARWTLAASLWLQPEGQRFFASSMAPGISGSGRLSIPLWSALEMYGEVTAKTSGWVPGDVFLGRGFDAQLGVEAVVF